MYRLQQKIWMGVLLGALLLCCGAGAAAQSSIPDEAIAGEISTLASHASLIFVGQITSIQRGPTAVQVTFRVEQAVSGAPGATYVMREWAGLWAPGHLRYSVGQRVLAFVHGASAAGFASPVHGAEGLIPVVVQGANASELLDIRRIAASVVRSANTPLPSERDGAVPLQQVLASFSLAGRHSPAAFHRLPVPFRAHPPAAMEPSSGSGWILPEETGTPARVASVAGGYSHVAR